MPRKTEMTPFDTSSLTPAHRPQWIAVVVFLAGAIISAAMFVAMQSAEHAQAQMEFARAADNHVSAIWNTVTVDLLQIQTIRAFYASSNEVDREEFRTLVTELIKNRPGIEAIQWAPREDGDDGEPTFSILWTEPRGRIAGESENLSAVPDYREAMRRAVETNRPMFVPEVLSGRDQPSRVERMKAFVAIYPKPTKKSTQLERRQQLLGYIVATLSAEGIVAEVLQGLQPVGMDFWLIDSTLPGQPLLLHRHFSRLRDIKTRPSDSAALPPPTARFYFSKTLDVAGRKWNFTAAAAPQFCSAEITWYPWIVAGGGLLLSCMLAVYLIRTGWLADRLSEREQMIRGVLDQTFQFMGLLKPDGTVVDANQAAINFSGAIKYQVIGKPFWNTPWWQHSPELQERLRQAVKRAARGETVHMEATHVAADGKLRWVDFSLKPLHDESGRVVWLIPEGHDVTAHKLAVQQQARSLERLVRVNRLQEELLLPAPMEEKLKRITDAAVELLELDFCRIWITRQGDLCDSGCMHATASEGPHICWQRRQCLHLMASSGRYTHIDGGHRRVPFGCYKIGRIASGQDKKFLTNEVTTDPRVHNHQWAKELGLVSFAGYKLHDIDERPVGVLAMFAKHPISEEDDAFLSNLAETASKVILDARAADALRASERQHRLYADNVSDVIWTMDVTGRFTYLSPSVEQMLGFKWVEGMNVTIADIMTPASLAIATDTLQHFIAEAQLGRRLKTSLELELVRRDGLTLWSEVNISGLYDEQGKITGAAGVTRDITQRRQMEDELRQAKEAAEAATKAKSNFLANMSHEIRNPMTAILGYTDLLMDPALSESNRQNYIAVIRRNGEHLLELINDILDISKIEAGKLTLDLQRCNLPMMLDDVANLVRPRAEQHGVELKVEYATPLPESILTDGPRLRQALLNLVGNAVKFTERGSVRIVGSLLPCWCGKPAVRIQVIDTGIGIRAEVLPRLFIPFNQGDEAVARKFGGTGLGLAITRHIAQMLGGELAATSQWQKGSVFSLTIPVGELAGVPMLENPGATADRQTAAAHAVPEKLLAGIHVLLAEDGFDNRELISTVLRAAGAEVRTAENGQEAVDKALAESFDVVLMDMNMPVMDGYEATRVLRDRGFAAPILALTANAMSTDGKQCLAAGCNMHLTKPIDRRALIGSVAACTGRGAEEEEETSTAPPSAARDSSPCGAGPLVSLYADDPDVSAILDQFVAGLAPQVADMRLALDEQRWEDLQRFAHRLKGAGGCYGYPALTDACKTLEDAAKAHELDAARAAVDLVAALCRAVEDGYHNIVSAGSNP
jgi:PAS domain S-box-containing protein